MGRHGRYDLSDVDRAGRSSCPNARFPYLARNSQIWPRFHNGRISKQYRCAAPFHLHRSKIGLGHGNDVATRFAETDEDGVLLLLRGCPAISSDAAVLAEGVTIAGSVHARGRGRSTCRSADSTDRPHPFDPRWQASCTFADPCESSTAGSSIVCSIRINAGDGRPIFGPPPPPLPFGVPFVTVSNAVAHQQNRE